MKKINTDTKYISMMTISLIFLACLLIIMITSDTHNISTTLKTEEGETIGVMSGIKVHQIDMIYSEPNSGQLYEYHSKQPN